MSSSPDAHPARCPRCGYDQRGAVAQWRDQCPIDGTCTECGLVFRWGNILQPTRFAPLWFVEFAPGRVRGTFRTMVGSLRPWRFWSRVQLSHPVRWRRLTLYMLVLLLVPVGAYVVEQGTVAARQRWLVARAPSVVDVRHSYTAAIIEAVFTPLASSSAGRIGLRGGRVSPYPAPRRLHDYLLQNRRPWLGRGAAMGEVVFTTIAAWVCGTILYVWLPLGFVFLPMSRRRARVRWRHVWRVAAYGMIFPSLALSASVVAIAIGLLTTWFSGAMIVAQGLTYGLVPVLLVWWSFAIGCYLRLPHGPVVALLLTVMGGLLIPAVIVLVSGASTLV